MTYRPTLATCFLQCSTMWNSISDLSQNTNVIPRLHSDDCWKRLIIYKTANAYSKRFEVF